MLQERMKEIYEELKGTRTVNGQLVIKSFDAAEDYEELYFTLLEELKPYILEVGEFETWYKKTCVQYTRYRRSTNRRYDFYSPQERPIHEHNLQEQLAVLKFFIYRRALSKYKSNVEKV